MWLKLATVSTMVVIQAVTGDDCTFTVSVLDVPGVRCVSAAPCSGTYYASGLSQGVGACPTGASCALLPLTPIMTCAASGRADLVYVNADGTLTKDGKSVTLLGAPSATVEPTMTPATTSVTSTTNSATDTSSTTKSATDSSTTDNSFTKNKDKSTTSNSLKGSNVSSESDSPTKNSDGNNGNDADASIKPLNNSPINTTSVNKVTSSSIDPNSGSDGPTRTVDSSSDKNDQTFNPGTILSDGPVTSNSSRQGGLGLGAIIAIVVGCLAVVAIAAGARLLKKGKDGQSATPGATGGLEAYNNVGGGGGGMTPKENVLLL
ncbi:unnamed protein product [Peronospora farinosa]|uniref:Mid2 domain-containing protein n=1 Tax=Peronospora farinosa TaxID=134698 RepID=A0AAV0TDX9_9STRA|nr:unnamed protein product [Peronospora farinosa]CAI5720292.1 unnamed protein product [Peronospora farinosa]